MNPVRAREALAAATDVARATAGLNLMILFGSRARGNHGAGSDWDFGYQGTPALDVTGLMTALVSALRSDRIDLVDLDKASGLLRFAAARDGLVVFETTPHLGDRFRFDAAQFWCDAAPALMRGYQDVLDGLKP
jgi:predicted nucleotidyltransferase